MEVTAESFLADCVRRRLLSGVPISPPERERFGAVLAFVDISGFSKLSEHLQVLPPMCVGSARVRRHGIITSAWRWQERHGDEGAELLQAHINRYFEPLIRVVCEVRATGSLLSTRHFLCGARMHRLSRARHDMRSTAATSSSSLATHSSSSGATTRTAAAATAR